MKTILVPTDFSKAAENALNTAKIIARKTNATIHIANFYSIPVVDYAYPDVSMSAEILEQTRKAAILGTEQVVAHLKDYGYSVASTVDIGLVSEEITALAGKIEADMIVMGTTGANGIVNKIMGSNAAHVMQKTTCPILLKPEKSNIDNIKNVIYLAQLEEVDIEILTKLFTLGEDLGFDNIKIVNVSTGFFFKEINEDLIDLMKKTFGSYKIKFANVEGADMKEGVDKYLEEHKTDLVVMSTHKKTFLERIFAKSNTQEMALYSNMPLLVYHKE